MAFTFAQQRKKQQYLIGVFILLILATSFMIWSNFFQEPKVILPSEIKTTESKKIEINLEVLNHPLLEKLQPFEEILPFEEEIGRENPFLPIE